MGGQVLERLDLTASRVRHLVYQRHELDGEYPRPVDSVGEQDAAAGRLPPVQQELSDTQLGAFPSKPGSRLCGRNANASSCSINMSAPQHLLLAMTQLGDPVLDPLFANFGLSTSRIVSATELMYGGRKRLPDLPVDYSHRATQVIVLAIELAQESDRAKVRPAHLLLAILRGSGGVVTGVFEVLGIDASEMEQELLDVIAGFEDEGTSSGDAGEKDEDAPDSFSGRVGPPNQEPHIHVQPEARTMTNFDRFTERARKVLQLAQEEAIRFNHDYIGTEHLLLGLVREGDGVAARVLSAMNVQLPKVRSAVEFIIGRGESKIVGEIGLTPRAKKVLELSVDEANRLESEQIGTEHLLLGMVREGEGIAAGVLESLGVNLAKVRALVFRAMAGEDLPIPPPPPPPDPAKVRKTADVDRLG